MDCETRAIELVDIVVIRGNNSNSVGMRSLANGNSRGSHNDGISDGKRNKRKCLRRTSQYKYTVNTVVNASTINAGTSSGTITADTSTATITTDFSVATTAVASSNYITNIRI